MPARERNATNISQTTSLHVWSLSTLKTSNSVSNVSLLVVATTEGAIRNERKSTTVRYTRNRAPRAIGIKRMPIASCPK